MGQVSCRSKCYLCTHNNHLLQWKSEPIDTGVWLEEAWNMTSWLPISSSKIARTQEMKMKMVPLSYIHTVYIYSFILYEWIYYSISICIHLQVNYVDSNSHQNMVLQPTFHPLTPWTPCSKGTDLDMENTPRPADCEDLEVLTFLCRFRK